MGGDCKRLERVENLQRDTPFEGRCKVSGKWKVKVEGDFDFDYLRQCELCMGGD
jgi:hypothetical protein